MKIISTVSELRDCLAGQSVAFVPTMGNLHEGHLDLMRQARRHGSVVVASIFVNPLQFGPEEDFDRYPRTFAADCDKARDLVDVMFAPAVNDMYEQKQNIFVELPEIANELCGAVRPGHFRGMATVVLKLLNIVQPQVALFGKKDYQQLHIVRQMVAQFNLPVRIIGGETVRASDGLALSSRNQYLSDMERVEAPMLFRTLSALSESLMRGGQDRERLRLEAIETLARRGWKVEYLELRSRLSLSKLDAAEQDGVILAAARLGKTRLLDNVEVRLAS